MMGQTNNHLTKILPSFNQSANLKAVLLDGHR